MNVLIATYLMDFNPGYSLTGIIYDQTIMLTKYGHKVTLLVSEQFNAKGLDFSHATVLRVMPFAHLIDYTTKSALTEDHADIAMRAEKAITALMQEAEVIGAPYTHVFTHDLVFTGWFLPYGIGIVNASKRFGAIPFMHWIHSIPGARRDWWRIKEFGKNNTLIFPNETDRIRVAEQYHGELSDVRVIPHIKDIRDWLDFSKDTRDLIDMIPNLLSAGVVCVLPAGSDRLATKGVDKVIKILAGIKSLGPSVFLVIANQWATGRQRKETLGPYISIAQQHGLIEGEDFVFTSDLRDDWANGLPGRMVRELFQLSNLFIFPTHCESFGLVVPEAMHAGVLPVLNKSLRQQYEISGGSALYFDFGSHVCNFSVTNEELYYRDLAAIIMGRLKENEAISAKTFCRRNYNTDSLYKGAYAPVMAELADKCK